MEQCVNALVDYFSSRVPKLEANYSWKTPAIAGFHQAGQRDFHANMALKHHLNKKWSASTRAGKYEIARQIVAEWGGVRGNKAETLTAYVDALESGSPDTPLKGVASYSKIFAVVDMERYAIYDARVAACLNAVQFNYGVTSGLAFNYISGRNNVVGHSGKKSGFVYHQSFKVTSLVDSGWSRIKRDDTYGLYLELLNRCLSQLPGFNLYELEMVLFADAESECLKALAHF